MLHDLLKNQNLLVPENQGAGRRVRRKEMKKIEGLYTALVTPFNEDLTIDWKSLERLVEFQLKGGVNGFVVAGTTGESPNLSRKEISEIYNFVKKQSPEGFPIVIGAGSNSTQQTIENVRCYNELNPTAYLVVTPYYNKPPQQGIFEHFKSVAAESDHDLILYDVPSRTSVGLELDTLKSLSDVPKIVGIKDATGDMGTFESQKVLFQEKNFSLLSGDDFTAPKYVHDGGDGVISVLSHLVPGEFLKTFEEPESFSGLQKLTELLFSESNPIPVKWALYRMGILNTPKMRLPLVPLSSQKSIELESEMTRLRLL